MRVALCLSGQLRTFMDCHEDTMRNIVLPYNADVFIHTWDKTGKSTAIVKYLPEALWTQLPVGFHRDSSDFILNEEQAHLKLIFPNLYSYINKISQADQLVDIDLLQKLYKPKGCVVEDYSACNALNKVDLNRLKKSLPTMALNAIPMFYKIHACDQLRKNAEIFHGEVYDRVIRLRPDFLLKRELPMEILAKPGIQTLFNEAFIDADRAFDAMAIGDAEGMSYYSSLWENLSYYYDPQNDPHCPLHTRGAEAILFNHLNKIGAGRSTFKLDPMPDRKIEVISLEKCLNLMEQDLPKARVIYPDIDSKIASAIQTEKKFRHDC